MQAVYFMNHGGPEVLQYGEVADPVARLGEVVVDVHAASVNAADWKVRSGDYGPPVKSFPHILGRDFSGVVSALGPGVKDLRIGDEVFGVCDVGQEGAYAEKIAIKAAIVTNKPSNLSHLECAAVALTGLTALVSIEDTLKLQPGQTILVLGGAGGVAGFAIQLARYIGARVISTTSTANINYVLGLGADEVIDYTSQDYVRAAPRCDAVFDTVGGTDVMKVFDVLRPGGKAAFIATGDAPPAPRADVSSLRPHVMRDRPHLVRVAELVSDGAVKVPKITTFNLADAARAHAISEGRHLRGKFVFKIR